MEARLEELERERIRVDGRLGGIEETFRQLSASVTELVELGLAERSGGRGSGNRGRNGEETQNEDGNKGRDNDRARRVEVPYFNGEDPYRWLFRAERYFRINRIPNEEHVETAVICLEGRALNWFQWWENRNPTNVWNDFRNAVLERFHLSSSGNPYEALMCLRQEGTIEEYREQFELLSSPLRHAEEEVMRAAFLNGLREDIRAELRLLEVNDLGRMMRLAQKVEEREKVRERMGTTVKGSGSGDGYGGGLQLRPALGNRASSYNKPNVSNAEGRSGPSGGTRNQAQTISQGSNMVNGNENGQTREGVRTEESTTNGGGPNPNQTYGGRGACYKRLSPEELSEKRRRNLCYRCDAPYSPDHVCQNANLHVMLLGVGGAEPEEDELVAMDDDAGREENENLRLSMHSLVGLTSSHSLKL